ncbi:hypothetical protein K466DRAFT_314049 [Polyporus arcularius HHB13444]|uniref:Uncharacterized protein n=1 Tax=Polyporus arcularius HHB13444 TaxID=1314778 RepID=A0A5C3PT46_9APHY|nr:hypothetical protein K466DRAFT_314049 [Polyporus arcularius HHB13444]
MADMLADNSVSVAVELILSTTTRALRAIASVLTLVIGGTVQQEPSLRSTTSAGAGASGYCTPCDSATLLGALTAILRRLVSIVFSSLRTHYTSAGSQAKLKRKSALGRTRASQTQIAAFNAIDDVLGVLYALVLAPIVRSFFLLSQGFTSACLGPCSKPNSRANSTRTNPGSGSRSSSGSKLPTDLRPAVLALLDDTLSALEEVLPGSPAVPSGPFSPGNAKVAAAAIPGAGQVKTLLALECMRELTKLYLPAPPLPCTEAEPSHSDSVGIGRTGGGHMGFVNDNSAEPGPGPSIREPTRGRGDTSSANSDRTITNAASTSRAGRLGTATGNHQPPRTFPGLAHVLYQNLGSSDDSTRPGTSFAHPFLPSSAASASSSSSGSQAPAAHAIFTGLRSRWADVAGNLGETLVGAISGPGCGLVRGGAPPASQAADSHAHAQRGERGGAEDLRVSERLARLARKDAVWYLCTALHRLLPAAPGSGSCSSAAGATVAGASTFTPPSSGPNMTPDVDTDPSGNQEEPGVEHAPTPACTPPASADTAAEQTVYDALADLLLRTQPPPRWPTRELSGLQSSSIAGSCPCSSSSSSSASSASSSAGSASPGSDSNRTGQLSRACAAGAPSASASVSVSVAVAVPTSRERGGTNSGGCESSAGAHTGAGDSEYLREPGRTRKRLRTVGDGARTRMQVEAGPASVRMGEVERGMLLAVLERAWLGV